VAFIFSLALHLSVCLAIGVPFGRTTASTLYAAAARLGPTGSVRLPGGRGPLALTLLLGRVQVPGAGAWCRGHGVGHCRARCRVPVPWPPPRRGIVAEVPALELWPGPGHGPGMAWLDARPGLGLGQGLVPGQGVGRVPGPVTRCRCRGLVPWPGPAARPGRVLLPWCRCAVAPCAGQWPGAGAWPCPAARPGARPGLGVGAGPGVVVPVPVPDVGGPLPGPLQMRGRGPLPGAGAVPAASAAARLGLHSCHIGRPAAAHCQTIAPTARASLARLPAAQAITPRPGSLPAPDARCHSPR
jgi:hypothetical protein